MAKDINVNETKSGFKPGVYAVFAILFVAAFLVIATIFAVKTHYTGFNSEKTAVSYVDTIVQNADGYNAYKQTLVSKNQKYGNFIINAYMKPYVNDGDDVEQREFADTEEEAAVKTPLYNTMYEYYKELVSTYGWDNYDSIFSNYFAKLAELRKELYGDDSEAKIPIIRTHDRHLPFSKRIVPAVPLMERHDERTMRVDNNNVDIDIETATMVKNQLYYNALATRLGGYVTQMKNIITSGQS